MREGGNFGNLWCDSVCGVPKCFSVLKNKKKEHNLIEEERSR